MSFLKRRKKLWLGLGVGLVAIYALLCLALPAWWSGPCGPGCDRRARALLIGPRSVSVYGFRYAAGSAELERWEVEAPRVTIRPVWSEVLRGRPVFAGLRAEGLRVLLSEGERKPPREKRPPAAFRFGAIRAVGAEFRYHRNYRGRAGGLAFDDIDLAAGALDSTNEEITTPVKLTARMEGTGRVEIDLKARFFAHDPRLDLRLTLKNQDLAGANAYFSPIDEIAMKGTLKEAACEVRGSHDRLQASVALRFKGFGVEFRSGAERSGLVAALSEAMAGALYAEGSDGKSFRPGYASLVRRERESPVSFVLRGLKEAAMRAARQ